MDCEKNMLKENMGRSENKKKVSYRDKSTKQCKQETSAC